MLRRIPDPIAVIDSIGAGVVSVASVIPKAIRDGSNLAGSATNLLISDMAQLKSSSLTRLIPTVLSQVMRMPTNAIRLGQVAFNDGKDNLEGTARDVGHSISRGLREFKKIVE